MVRLIVSGLWVCLVTLASLYGAVWWQTAARSRASVPAEAGDPNQAVIEPLKTRMISVPVVGDGTIHGYVMAQFIFNVNVAIAKRLPVKADMLLLDEAFKTIYAGDVVDFRHFKKQDLANLSKGIADNANKRFGVNLVEDVLIQELNYIAKDQVRGGRRL
ncbi:MAG TPA: hypothetical protein VFR19_13075 [Hyphomicrobiaceae bacterium]|jgi:hypothetical protein|nr:hypothetical protein [Hyphomicrobiaceae bacterium]